jgi:hypothetical protein
VRTFGTEGTTNIQKAMKQTKHTPGPWIAKPVYGWGDKHCIVAAGKYRPLAQTIMPKEYYTDYPTRTDSKTGEVFTVCSTAAAIEAGNYVATDAIRAVLEAENDANARLIATAPELLDAAMAFDRAYEACNTILAPMEREAFEMIRAAIAKATNPSADL